MQAAKIREWVEQARSARNEGTPYPPALREAVVAHAVKQREEGQTWRNIEIQVGLSGTTIRNWMRQQRHDGGFQQLQVVRPAQPQPVGAAPVLTSPAGYQVTGCSVEDIARLLVVLG